MIRIQITCMFLALAYMGCGLRLKQYLKKKEGGDASETNSTGVANLYFQIIVFPIFFCLFVLFPPPAPSPATPLTPGIRFFAPTERYSFDFPGFSWLEQAGPKHQPIISPRVEFISTSSSCCVNAHNGKKLLCKRT